MEDLAYQKAQKKQHVVFILKSRIRFLWLLAKATTQKDVAFHPVFVAFHPVFVAFHPVFVAFHPVFVAFHPVFVAFQILKIQKKI